MKLEGKTKKLQEQGKSQRKEKHIRTQRNEKSEKDKQHTKVTIKRENKPKSIDLIRVSQRISIKNVASESKTGPLKLTTNKNQPNSMKTYKQPDGKELKHFSGKIGRMNW